MRPIAVILFSVGMVSMSLGCQHMAGVCDCDLRSGINCPCAAGYAAPTGPIAPVAAQLPAGPGPLSIPTPIKPAPIPDAVKPLPKTIEG